MENKIEKINIQNDKASRQSKKSIMRNQIKLGIIKNDYNYIPIPGDVDHHGSFHYEVVYRVVPGLTFELCQSGKLTADILQELIEAIAWLEERNVSAITGNCGFMLRFQNLVQEHSSSTPVFMSSLLQLPAITCTLPKASIICIFTANLASLKSLKNFILEMVSTEVYKDNLMMVSCKNVPGFEVIDKGENVIREVLEPGVVDLALTTLKENPDISCFLFECTQLAAFSNAVREATGIPVYDAITGCNFFTSGFQEEQLFGKTNWKQKWSGHPKELYQIGQELEVNKRRKLVSIDFENSII